MGQIQTHYRTCSLCEVMCGIVIEHRDGEIVSIKPNKDDVLSHGHICPKAVALKDLHEDPDRLRMPMRRDGAQWREISWEEAFDEIEARITAIRELHGRDAVALYVGNPTVHNLGAMLNVGNLVRALKTRNFYSATSVDQLPHMFVSYMSFGHQFLMPVPDIDRTQLFVCIGGNPLASGGSLMGAPGFEKRVEAMKARGGRLVVIDPRRTETAQIADDYIAVRPGADVFLLLGLVREVFAAKLESTGTLAQHVDGIDDLRAAVMEFEPTSLAERAGVASERIAALARDIAAEPRAVVYARVGACTQEFGGLTIWLVNCLNALTGHLDVEGGMMFPQPAVDLTRAYGSPGHHDRFRSRVRGLPEFGNELPVSTLSDEILEPGQGQVRALITFAGNPVLSTPNGRRLDQALESLEFMVSVDLYLNETTRHAHLILPPTGPLEHSHYDIALSGFAVRNVAKYSPPLFEKPAGARHDHEILSELALRLGTRPGVERLQAAVKSWVMRGVGPDRMLGFMLRGGPYGKGSTHGLSLARLRKSPNGIDLGPLQPNLLGRLRTRDRRIKLAPEIFLQDLARARDALRQPVPALMLIGRRHVRSNNSWLHNSHRLVKGKPRCTLMIHPDDASRSGIVDGSRVRLRSRVGEVEVPAEVTEDVMPGVVCLPHGWGHDREGTRLTVASAHAGASINDLIDDRSIDRLTGTAVLNGTPVEVAAAAPQVA